MNEYEKKPEELILKNTNKNLTAILKPFKISLTGGSITILPHRTDSC